MTHPGISDCQSTGSLAPKLGRLHLRRWSTVHMSLRGFNIELLISVRWILWQLSSQVRSKSLWQANRLEWSGMCSEHVLQISWTGRNLGENLLQDYGLTTDSFHQLLGTFQARSADSHSHGSMESYGYSFPGSWDQWPFVFIDQSRVSNLQEPGEWFSALLPMFLPLFFGGKWMILLPTSLDVNLILWYLWYLTMKRCKVCKTIGPLFRVHLRRGILWMCDQHLPCKEQTKLADWDPQ